MGDAQFSISSYLASLESQLSGLHIHRQVAFGAWCSERLSYAYRDYAERMGMSDAIRPIMDRIWRHVFNEPMSVKEIDQYLEECNAIPIGEELAGCNEAIDAIDATLLVLKACRRGSLKEIVKVAECALNRIDRVVEHDILGTNHGVLTPAANRQLSQAIYAHPAFQHELSLQAKQLDYLQGPERLSLERVMSFV